MSSRTLLNLVLLLLTAALALLVYYQPGLEAETPPETLTTRLRPNEAGNIRIERLARGPLGFSKRDGRWLLAHGEQELPASEFQVLALLRLLEATASASYPADSVDLEELGLDPALARVIIDAVDISVGTTEALENRRYVRLGDTVYLITDRYQHLLNAEWSNFVSRRLLNEADSLTRLELPALTLTRTGEGHWRIDPEPQELSADAPQQLVDHWMNATALYVRSYAGEDAAETITLQTSDRDAPLVFAIVARSPDLVLARPELGIQYHLGGDLQTTLLKLPEPVPDSEASTGNPIE